MCSLARLRIAHLKFDFVGIIITQLKAIAQNFTLVRIKAKSQTLLPWVWSSKNYPKSVVLTEMLA